MSCRFCVSSATTVAPAVVARPRISSQGSSVGQGRSGRATLTRTAFSLATENSSRWVSNALLMSPLPSIACLVFSVWCLVFGPDCLYECHESLPKY